MAVQLEYRGQAGIDDANGFNARTNVMWKGDLLFRCYPGVGRMYFIKVGGSKQQNYAVAAQFGLLGALIAYLSNKREKRKTQERLNAVVGMDPEVLLGQDKVNRVRAREEMREPRVEGPSVWVGRAFGAWVFRDGKGKKRVYTFDDADNFRAGVARLREFFGEELKVMAEWDEVKKKVVRVK